MEARRTLWSDLGVDPQTAELLAAHLQFVWADDRIYHLAGAFFDGDLCDSVASALLAVWKFPHFTESRWLTVGTSCRTMVASLLTGVESLVRFVKQEGVSLWYLKGFDRLQVRQKDFLVTCGLVSRVAEAFQAALMQYNRVAKTADAMLQAVAEQVKWIIDLGQCFCLSWEGSATFPARRCRISAFTPRTSA